MGVEGKIAVVTGAAQGIGREYATGLAQDGAIVVAADINQSGAEETAKEIERAGGRCLAVGVDVSARGSTLAMAEAVKREFGGADILVNNAAIYHSMRMDPMLTVDIDYWRRIFSVNLDGALLCTQALAPQMIERGWGRIVNQSSTAAHLGGIGPYGASKLAMGGLTVAFARELGPHGITVNAIAPGPVHTEATEVTVPKAAIEHLEAGAPIHKQGMPADLVGTLRYLVSDAAAWVTGQTLIVDGGYIVRF